MRGPMGLSDARRNALDPVGARTGLGGRSSYVSRLIADRLASGGPIEQLEATTVRAALLLTDIVGFSAYVDRVSAARSTGLEELARDFDTYFTDVVGIVNTH